VQFDAEISTFGEIRGVLNFFFFDDSRLELGSIILTLKSIPPFFFFSSELEELDFDFPFFNPISTLVLMDGI
jgi:hypothetical protein